MREFVTYDNFNTIYLFSSSVGLFNFRLSSNEAQSPGWWLLSSQEAQQANSAYIPGGRALGVFNTTWQPSKSAQRYESQPANLCRTSWDERQKVHDTVHNLDSNRATGTYSHMCVRRKDSSLPPGTHTHSIMRKGRSPFKYRSYKRSKLPPSKTTIHTECVDVTKVLCVRARVVCRSACLCVCLWACIYISKYVCTQNK